MAAPLAAERRRHTEHTCVTNRIGVEEVRV